MASVFDSYLPHAGYLLTPGTPNDADNGQTETGATRTSIRCRFQRTDKLVRKMDGSYEQAAALVFLPSDTATDGLDKAQVEINGRTYRILTVNPDYGPAGTVLAIQLTLG